MSITIVLSPTNLQYKFTSQINSKLSIAVRSLVIPSNTFSTNYQSYFIRCDQLDMRNNYDNNGNESNILCVVPVGSATSNIMLVDSLKFKQLINDSVSILSFAIT